MGPARVRAVQLSLFDEDFAIDEEMREFAHLYIANGFDGTAAMMHIRPHLSRDAAVTAVHRWLGTRRPSKSGVRKGKGHPELLRYISWRQAQVALRAELTEDELVAMSRRVYMHAVGDVPVTKTVYRQDGPPSDHLVCEPNLAAANTAVENLRKIGGFGKEGEQVGAGGTPLFTPTERALRVAALLQAAKRDEGASDV
jgi:hypothetical protein